MAAPVTNGAGGLPPDMMREQGTAVDTTRVFSAFEDGRIFEPRDVTPRRLDKMLRVDGKARSIEQALTLPLRGAPWSIHPGSGDRGEADWVREAITRPANAGGMSTPIELVIAQATSACLFRRAFFEKVFVTDPDGRVVYDKLAFRPPATCDYLFARRTGAFQGFRQYVGSDHEGADETGRVTIKARNAFVFVYGQHRRPVEGVSDLETVYALFETKQKIRYLWMTFLENQVMPKAVAKDNTDDPGHVQEFATKVATLKGGGVLGIGQDQDVSPFETSIAAADAFNQAMRFIDGEMSGSVLAGMLDLTGSAASGKGSFALSSDASDLFMRSRQAVLAELASAIVNFVIADLVQINFGRSAVVPRFSFGQLIQQNVEQAFTLLTSLAAAQPEPGLDELRRQLIVRVASYLDLNEAKVAKAIDDAQSQAPQDPLSQIRAGVNVGQALVDSLPA